MTIYETLQHALRKQVQVHRFSGRCVRVRCKALSSIDAIGQPEQRDYPIIKGKEVIVEADFEGVKGQAFTDEFENADYLIDDLLTINLDSNARRASFVSGLNAVFRYLHLCDKTVHCKDDEPKACADYLTERIKPGSKVLLVGYQPRFLEKLASACNLRVVDLDQDNIGSEISGVIVDPPEMTNAAIEWCDLIFATGSTVVNGTIGDFLGRDKSVLFYGITVSAAAEILGLDRYCYCGH